LIQSVSSLDDFVNITELVSISSLTLDSFNEIH